MKNRRGLPATNDEDISSHIKLRTNEGEVVVRIRGDSAYVTLLNRSSDGKSFVFALKEGDPPRMLDPGTEELNFNEQYASIRGQAQLASLADLYLKPGMFKEAVHNLLVGDKDSREFANGLLVVLMLLEAARQDPFLNILEERCSIPGELGLVGALLVLAWGYTSRYFDLCVRKLDFVLDFTKTPIEVVKARILKIEHSVGVLKSPSRRELKKKSGTPDDKEFLKKFEKQINNPTKPLYHFFNHGERFQDHNFDEPLNELERVQDGTVYINKEKKSFWTIVRGFGPIDSWEVVFKSLEKYGEIVYPVAEQRLSFAFVEFKNYSGFVTALQASPIIVLGKKVLIEERRSLHHEMASSSGIGSHLKTCTRFFSASGCLYGERCNFLHHVPGGNKGVTQIFRTNPHPTVPTPPNLAAARLGSSSLDAGAIIGKGLHGKSHKGEPCLKFRHGSCTYGDECRFVHGGEWRRSQR